jgi:hypothetical protein
MYWRETGAGKAISETISGAEIGICYASALCFAVRLVLLRAKTDIAGFELPIRNRF